MIRRPRWRISADKAERVHCSAETREVFERIQHLLPDVCRFTGLNGINVRVHEEIPLHHGLGAGTQLTLAIVTAAQILAGIPRSDCSLNLAGQFNRVRRSAVGAFGFDRGGLITDEGVSPDDTPRRLHSLELPPQWRVVLLIPSGESGLSGSQEETVFQQRRCMTDMMVDQQSQRIQQGILPAVRTADFPAFRDALGEFGQLTGRFFAPQQGGVYSSPVIRQLTALPEFQTLQPVQSSWGPVVAEFASSAAEAEALVDRIGRSPVAEQLSCSIEEPLNCGASVRSVAPEVSDHVVRG